MSTSTRRLGQIFHEAMTEQAEATAAAPPDDAAAGPTWPYLLGAFGGGVFGLGALLLLGMVLAQIASPGLGRSGLVVLAIGSGILGCAWLGMVKQGRDGVGAMLGSFAIPAAIAIIYVNRDDFSLFRAHAMLLELALASFAMGHLFVQGLVATRVAAAVALLASIVVLFATTQSAQVPPGIASLLAFASLGGLGIAGCSLALALPGLRGTRDR